MYFNFFCTFPLQSQIPAITNFELLHKPQKKYRKEIAKHRNTIKTPFNTTILINISTGQKLHKNYDVNPSLISINRAMNCFILYNSMVTHSLPPSHLIFVPRTFSPNFCLKYKILYYVYFHWPKSAGFVRNYIV